jgi:hypothetical protein
MGDHGGRLLVAGEERLPRREVLCPVDVSRSHGGQFLGRNPGEGLVAVEKLVPVNQVSKELALAPDSPRRL